MKPIAQGHPTEDDLALKLSFMSEFIGVNHKEIDKLVAVLSVAMEGLHHQSYLHHKDRHL